MAKGQLERKDQMELVRTIGARMKQAREMCNLSQCAAAKRLGYANSSKLAKVENASDTSSVPLLLILRASRVYEVSIDFLFGITDDWETGVRMCIERETSAWLFDAWEKYRQRDMAVLKKLHDRHEAMADAVASMLASAEETSAALEKFIKLNRDFDDMPGGARLVSAVERAASAARHAKAKMARFRVECAMAAADTNQLSLMI